MMMIKYSGLVAALLLLLGVLYGMFVAAVPKMDRDLSLPFSVHSTWREILYYASLAPSSHNAQMWRVRYDPNTDDLFVSLDLKRTLPKVDPNHREAYLSLGAFLENFRQAANALGYRTEIRVQPETPSRPLGARLRLIQAPNGSLNREILTVMEKRHTDKRLFQPIAETQLKNFMASLQTTVPYYPKGSNAFTYLSTQTVQAMAQQSSQPENRRELANWLRFSNSEAVMTRDGLPAEQLGIGGLKKVAYYGFVDRKTAQNEMFAEQSVELTAQQVAHCAGFFVITGGQSPGEWLSAGMRMEAFWLAATRHGISIQPMSQLLEEAPYRNNVSAQLGLTEPVQMIFRAGTVADYGVNSKIRRKLSNFVTAAVPVESVPSTVGG